MNTLRWLDVIAAVLDRRERLSRGALTAAFESAGVALQRRSGPLWLGWADAVFRTAAGTSVLVEGPDAAEAVDAFQRLASGDTTRLRSLRGAFAGLVWSDLRAHGAIARDHFGRRALFVANQSGVAYVASEVAPLLAMLPRRPAPDTESLALWLGYQPLGTRSLFSGLGPLLPGHWMPLGGDVLSARPFWDAEPLAELAGLSRDEAAVTLWAAIRSAVGRQVASSSQPGVLLSGGLDSSAVLAAAADAARARGAWIPPVFSTLFPDHPEVDESRFIDATAGQLGARQSRHAAHPRSVLADAEEFLMRWEVPQDFPGRGFFHDALAAAASAGVDVLFDGEGGDELFGCEPYLVGDLVLRGHLLSAGRVAREIPGMRDRVSRRAVEMVVRKWLIGGLLPASIRQITGRLDGRGLVNGTLRPSSRDTVLQSLHDTDWRHLPGPRARAHRLYLLIDRPRSNGSMDYIRRKAAMAQIREESVLLEPDLVATALGLPPMFAFHRHRDKELLRLTLRGRIPDDVRLREDKTSFGRLPLESLRDLDREALLRLADASPELDAYVNLPRARSELAAGPAAHPRGSDAWLMDAWRLATLAQWFRRQAG